MAYFVFVSICDIRLSMSTHPDYYAYTTSYTHAVKAVLQAVAIVQNSELVQASYEYDYHMLRLRHNFYNILLGIPRKSGVR